MASGQTLNTVQIEPLRRAAGERCSGIAASVLGVSDIDWAVPWLADWRAVGEPLAARIAAGLPQPQILSGSSGAPVSFVPQAELPAGMAYEAFIRDTAQVPTREGLHDFFNALCWMHFPKTKLHLNRLQAAEIARDGVQSQRGAVRDAITVFDENAVLIQAPDVVWDALSAHCWHEALVQLRPLWQDVRLWMFGHATLEKLVRPYKSITAHLWRVPQSVSSDALDAWLTEDLNRNKLASKPFSPLPLLGVPGWWAANNDARFYADADVFRPRRKVVPLAQ